MALVATKMTQVYRIVGEPKTEPPVVYFGRNVPHARARLSFENLHPDYRAAKFEIQVAGIWQPAVSCEICELPVPQGGVCPACSAADIVARGVALGEAVLASLDRLANERGSSRSKEFVRLVLIALDAPIQPPIADHAWLDGPIRYGAFESYGNQRRARHPARATLRAPMNVWSRIDLRSRRQGESVSEAIRALVHGGLAAGRL